MCLRRTAATTACGGRQASPRPSGPRPRRTGEAACGPSPPPNYGSCATISRRRSTAPSRSPLALRRRARSKRAWMVGRVGGDPRFERGGVAEVGGLLGELDLGADGGDRGSAAAESGSMSPASGAPARARRWRAAAGEAGDRAAIESGSLFRAAAKRSAAPAASPAASSALALGDEQLGVGRVRPVRRRGR